MAWIVASALQGRSRACVSIMWSKARQPLTWSSVKVACPAVNFVVEDGEYATQDGKTKKRKGHSLIDELMCTGCGVCAQVCRFEAIGE